MRTAEECQAKALELDMLAVVSNGTAIADYQLLAEYWRQLATQATWQASFRFIRRPVLTSAACAIRQLAGLTSQRPHCLQNCPSR